MIDKAEADWDEFDSSYKRGSPTEFAPNQVIKGWTEAMQLMVEGDKWEMYIPSELGYGDGGSGAKIKGGDVLVFRMEILKIKGNKKRAANCNLKTLEDCEPEEVAVIGKWAKSSMEEIAAEMLFLKKRRGGGQPLSSFDGRVALSIFVRASCFEHRLSLLVLLESGATLAFALCHTRAAVSIGALIGEVLLARLRAVCLRSWRILGLWYLAVVLVRSHEARASLRCRSGAPVALFGRRSRTPGCPSGAALHTPERAGLEG